MKYIISIVLLVISLSAYSQAANADCEVIFNSAYSLFKSGNYSLAIKKVSAYKICANTNQNIKADALLLKIYETVNKQKEDAIKAKKEAERQTRISNQRAAIIQSQRDSIQRENKANEIAVQALQKNKIDPNLALETVYKGFCYSVGNASLIETRKTIIADGLLFKAVKGASPYNTISIAKLNSNLFYTSDSQGEIKLWDASTFQLTDRIKPFNGSIYLSQKIDDHSIIVCGNDLRNASYQIKILDLSKNNAIRVIADSIPSNITSVTPGYEEGSFFFGTESGDIFKLELPSMNFSKFKTVTSKIVGLQCWAASKKLFYATPTGVFDLMTDRSYYTSPPDDYITYLGFCQSIAQFYIGMGEDMLLYDILTGCDHKLYPVHDSMITSCTCSESTGTFLTTSLDGYGALWTKNGNINEVLKGNKAELYGGYLDPDEKFAVTVGRREMSTNRAADTSTIKYWFLSGFFEEKKEAHLFGATSVIYANNLDYVITGGNNGQVKIWDEHLNLIESRDINHSGISALFWDENKNKIWFGTFDGNTGYIELSENGKVVSINSIQTHTEKVNSIVIDTKGKVYSVGKDGVLFIQDNQNNRMDSVYFDWEIAELQFSMDYKSILFAASDKVVLFDLTTRKKTIFQHDVKVNSVKWINRTQFASVSGQFLRIWNTNNQGTLILKADNNLRNVMTSLYVDTKQGLIYTGMWSGFIFCWDFYGRQLFELDQLTSLADNSIIHGICGSKDNLCFYSVDYNGNLAKWYSPYSFINKQLSIKSDCSE